MSSPFCLSHCCPSPTKVLAVTKEEEEFLSPEEPQKVWELQDQESQSQTQNLAPSSTPKTAVSTASQPQPRTKNLAQPRIQETAVSTVSQASRKQTQPSLPVRRRPSSIPQIQKEHPTSTLQIEDLSKSSSQIRIQHSLVPKVLKEQTQSQSSPMLSRDNIDLNSRPFSFSLSHCRDRPGSILLQHFG